MMDEFDRMEQMMSSMHRSFGMPSMMLDGPRRQPSSHNAQQNAMTPFGNSMFGNGIFDNMGSMMVSYQGVQINNE